MPRKISLPSTVACKSRISSNDSLPSESLFIRKTHQLLSWRRNAECPADGACCAVRYFTVTRHGGGLLSFPVDVERVFPAFTDELATARLKMPDEVAPLHAVRNSTSSRSPAASPARRRFPSKTISIASARLALASSRVLPREIAPGSSATEACTRSPACS